MNDYGKIIITIILKFTEITIIYHNQAAQVINACPRNAVRKTVISHLSSALSVTEILNAKIHQKFEKKSQSGDVLSVMLHWRLSALVV